jgi:diaminopimelate epimerase
VPSSAKSITVHMDGGDVRVLLDEPERGKVTLVGPSQYLLTTTVDV